MILVQVNEIARYFGDVVLYEDVNFNIQSRDRIALVGRNGTGKSTLIKQITGQEPISKGSVSKARDISIGYLEQHVAIDSSLTIWQEMLTVFSQTLALRDQAQEAADRLADLANQTDTPAYQEAVNNYDRIREELDRRNAYGIESEIRTVLHGFGYYEEDYDTPVQALSGGQKTRLTMAKILLEQHDLLILDEPTNHLDMETLAWLETYLTNYRGALLIVSHDRYFLNRTANQVIELRNHTSHIYKGNYDYYLQEKAQRLEQEWKTYRKQQTEIAKLEDFVQKNIVRASTTKRAQSRRKQLERMQKIDKPDQDRQAPRIQFSAAKPSGDRVIEVQNLAIGYPNQDQPLAEGINFDLRRQEAIAVVGPNGVGKTTLLRTLVQQIPALAGSVDYGTNVEIGYYDQNVNQLNPRLTVLETLWQEHPTVDEWQIRSILGSFLFTGEDVEKSVGLLSGGEKARLSLALLAMNHDNTLLLDEPTNHLDIDSKEVLEEALIEFDGTIFFVSHDRYFINRIASQVLEISPEGATLYLGDYDYYQAKKAEMAEIEYLSQDESVKPEEVGPKTAQLDYETNKQIQRQVRQLEKAVREAEEANEAVETRLSEINLAMVQAAESNNNEEIITLHQEQEELQASQLEHLEAWEEASLALEDLLAQYPQFAK